MGGGALEDRAIKQGDITLIGVDDMFYGLKCEV